VTIPIQRVFLAHFAEHRDDNFVNSFHLAVTSGCACGDV